MEVMISENVITNYKFSKIKLHSRSISFLNTVRARVYIYELKGLIHAPGRNKQKHKQSNLGFLHAVSQMWKKLRLITQNSGVCDSKTVESDGEYI